MTVTKFCGDHTVQVQVIARICVLATLQLSVYTMNSQTIAIYFISHSVILYALVEKIVNKKKACAQTVTNKPLPPGLFRLKT